MNSESGMAPITHFKAATFPTTFAAEVKPDFDYRTFLTDPKVHATTALNAQFALGAARQAWNQAGFHTNPPKDPRRVGLYLGAGEGVLDFDNYAGALISAWDAAKQKVDGVRWAKAALARLDAFKEIEQEPNMSLAHLAREFGIRGPASNCNRVRRQHAGHRRSLQHDPPRRHRHHDVWWNAHHDSSAWRDRFQSTHRVEHFQRRPNNGKPSILHEPRRLCHGRGQWNGDS
jgi:hypothetical protein